MTVTVERESRRRLFLGSIVPFALLLIALVAVPHFLPGGVVAVYRARMQANRTIYADSPYAGAPCGSDTEVEGCNFKAADEAVRKAFSAVTLRYRKSALGVVDRWEQECRRHGGLAAISPEDLMQLRRALL